jgi:hypothetical protein
MCVGFIFSYINDTLSTERAMWWEDDYEWSDVQICNENVVSYNKAVSGNSRGSTEENCDNYQSEETLTSSRFETDNLRLKLPHQSIDERY